MIPNDIDVNHIMPLYVLIFLEKWQANPESELIHKYIRSTLLFGLLVQMLRSDYKIVLIFGVWVNIA